MQINKLQMLNFWILKCTYLSHFNYAYVGGLWYVDAGAHGGRGFTLPWQWSPKCL